jgi:hypothetical protein
MRSLAILSLVMVSSLAAAGCAASKQPAPTLLFVQTAEEGTLAELDGDATAYRLTLRRAAPRAVYFTDRPYRSSGTLSNEALAAAWDPATTGSFAADPPNAALSVEETGQVFVFELERAAVDGDVVTYTARRLDHDGRFCCAGKPSAAGAPPARFGRVALFIDNALDPYHMNQSFVAGGDPYHMGGSVGGGPFSGDPYGMASDEMGRVKDSTPYEQIHVGGP